MTKRIGLVSLGCPKNLVDSEVMLGLARRAGHEITSDPEQADVLVVNTCAFIESARQESVDAILEMAEHTRGTGRRLVVTGCLAERYGAELQRQIPEIDVLVGTGEVPRIVEAIEGGAAAPTAAGAAFYRDRHAAAAAASLPFYLYDATTPRVLATPGHYAYVKVAEGCDYHCTFCIIPRLRGPYRSRAADSIVDEARTLAAAGVKELILVSQDTTFYGVDRGERGALARLLRRLNGIDGLAWIRLLYLYPTTVGDDVLDAIAECEKVCKYVDLPLQHASDRVLKRMGRPGTHRSYDRLLARIRRRVPGVTLRTTFIVGFPGETEEEFEELLAFVTGTRFDHLGVFTYSHEEQTRAFRLADDVPSRVKRARRGRLMTAQGRLVRQRHLARRGERVVVLVDGPSAEHELVLQGRLPGQAPEIDPVVYLDGADPASCRPGDMIAATLAASRGYDLVARVDRGPGR